MFVSPDCKEAAPPCPVTLSPRFSQSLSVSLFSRVKTLKRRTKDEIKLVMPETSCLWPFASEFLPIAAFTARFRADDRKDFICRNETASFLNLKRRNFIATNVNYIETAIDWILFYKCRNIKRESPCRLARSCRSAGRGQSARRRSLLTQQ